MKKVIVILIVCAFILSGCRNTLRYYGKYPEYFSIAANSLLGISGYEREKIEVLESDEYGRILFLFISPSYRFENEKGLFSIMICQKTDKEYAYFYPDYHFIVRNTREEILEEDINALKSENSWGENLDGSRMVKVRILYAKKTMDNAARFRKTQIFDGWIDSNTETISLCRFGIDEKGRSLYLAWIQNKKDYTDKSQYIYIINEDYTYDESIGIQEIEDIWNYQDQLKAFKELNDWVPDLE